MSFNRDTFRGIGSILEEIVNPKKKEDIEEAYAKDTPKQDDGEGLDKPGEEDSDVDNDGDSDESDQYLKKRRSAVKKAVTKDK